MKRSTTSHYYPQHYSNNPQEPLGVEDIAKSIDTGEKEEKEDSTVHPYMKNKLENKEKDTRYPFSCTANFTLRSLILSFVISSIFSVFAGIAVSRTFLKFYVRSVFEQPDTNTKAYSSHLVINIPYNDIRILENIFDESSDDSSDDEEEEGEGEKITYDYERRDPDNLEYAVGAGHQIFVKIRNVDPSFVTSKAQMSVALFKVISKTDLSILSYHCMEIHDSKRGVNCIGIMKEGSHISVQSWVTGLSKKINGYTKFEKDEMNGGVITLDILSSGPNQSKLLDMVIGSIEEEFAVPLSDEHKPIIRWNLKQRHTQENPGTEKNPYWEDLGERLTTADDMKKKIVSVTSPFQRIDVWEFVDSKRNNQESYLRSLSNDGSYESSHPELFAPDIEVYLDGVLQSTKNGNEPYHEALVQPAMFTHPRPRRVAIIGGGEGATLREVLKHQTIEKVLMIDIDETMVKESAKLLYPIWNGCDDIVGSTPSCFDDPRADVRYQDALAWFIDRFYEDENADVSEDDENEDKEDNYDETDPFDVIIMDALDPHDNVDFATTLYNDDIFFKSLYSALGDDGVLVAQLGEANSFEDPAEEETENANRAAVMTLLEQVGFESVHMYEETHCGFEWPWQFAIACKNYECRSRWYANTAEISKLIHQRILRSVSGEPLLKYFDGATMAGYQVPTKSDEAVYCRKNPKPKECGIGEAYSRDSKVFKTEHFEIEKSEDDDELYVKALVNIPEMSYIETGELMKVPRRVEYIMSATLSSLNVGSKLFGALSSVQEFTNIVSHNLTYAREEGTYVDTSLSSLINYNHVNGSDANVEHLGSYLSRNNKENRIEHRAIFNPFSPVVARHLSTISSGYLISNRNIKKGEKLFKMP